MTYVVGNATHLRGRVLSGDPRGGDVYRYDGAAFVCDNVLNECEEEIARNRRNIQLLFLQQATYEHIVRGDAVNGFYDSFEDASGVDQERLVGEYSEAGGCFLSAAELGPWSSPFLRREVIDRKDHKGPIAAWRQDQGAAGHFEAAEAGFDVNAAAVSVAGGAKTGLPATGHGMVAGDAARLSGFVNGSLNGVFVVQPETTADLLVVEAAYAAETMTSSCKRAKVLSLGAGRDASQVTEGLLVRIGSFADVSILHIDEATAGRGAGKVMLSAAMPSGPVEGVFDAALHEGLMRPAYRCNDAVSIAEAATPGTRPSPRQLFCEIVHPPTRRYYAIGGARFSDGQYVRDCWEYDIDGDSWRLLTLNGDEVPYGRHHSAAFVPSVGKYLIMAIQIDQQGVILNGGRLWMAWFDPVALSWTNITPLNYPTLYQRASGAYDPVNHCFWLFGGDTTRDQTGVSNELWRYDIEANAWTEKGLNGAKPSPRGRMAMIYDPSGGLLMYGGWNASNVFLSDLWRYDIATDAWTQLSPGGAAPIPLANQRHCYEPANGRWYHWGGMTTGGVYSAALMYYAAAENAWSVPIPSGTMYGSHCSRSAISILDGRLYAFAGAMVAPFSDAMRIIRLHDPVAAVSAAVGVANAAAAVDANDAFSLAVSQMDERAAEGSAVYYALSWDDGETWTVCRDGVWREIVRQDAGVWQRREASGLWEAATDNDVFTALRQAVLLPLNQMDREALTAAADAAWETAATWWMPCHAVRVAAILVCGSSSAPAVMGWTFNRRGGLDIRSVPAPLQPAASRISASFLIQGAADAVHYYLAADASHPEWVPLPNMTKVADMAGAVEYWASGAAECPGNHAGMALRIRAAGSAAAHGWAASWNG